MMTEPQNTKGIWALAIAVVLLVLGGIFAVLDKPVTSVIENPRPTPIPLPTEVAETQGFAKYEGQGYELKYPPDFVLGADTSDAVLLTAPIKTYFQTILANEAYVIIYPPKDACPESRGENFTATTSLSSLDRTVFSRVEWSGIGAGQAYKGVDYTTIHSGKCYQISLYTHSANGAGFYFNKPEQIEMTDKRHAVDMASFFDLIDKTVSTFQFKAGE